MVAPCRLVDAPGLPVYDLGQHHPFARERQLPLFDLLQRMDLVSDQESFEPPTATAEQLQKAHDADYIAMVQAVSASRPDPATMADAWRFGLGSSDNPIGVGQHEAAAAAAGATAACVRAVVDGAARHAMNSAGGLHHALRRAASGFCIYNDLAVGILEALEPTQAAGLERVLYVDFDVHHGDGVEFAFRSDPRVTTVSFHQSPDTLFPGTGRITDRGDGDARGTVVNMPFAPGTGDGSWWHAVSTLLPKVVRRFKPQLIVSQHGCDPHREDPLADLQLTTRPMFQAAELTRDLALEVCDGRWVATGGGGYQPYRVIPRAWALVWLAMRGQPVPDALEPAWIDKWQHQSREPLCPTFFDPELPNPRAAGAARQNESTLQQLLELQELV